MLTEDDPSETVEQGAGVDSVPKQSVSATVVSTVSNVNDGGRQNPGVANSCELDRYIGLYEASLATPGIPTTNCLRRCAERA